MKETIVDTRFGLKPVREFDILIPKEDYLFPIGFNGLSSGTGYRRGISIGKKYHIEIFQIVYEITGLDCLNFAIEKGAILNNFEGLDIVRVFEPEKLPIGYIHSFNHKSLLFKYDEDGEENVVVICLEVKTPELIDWKTSYFDGNFGPPVDYILLMFEK